MSYAQGKGIPQDAVEAHMWLNLAASRSPSLLWPIAVEARDAVAVRRMTPADLSEAQRRRQLRIGRPDSAFEFRNTTTA